MTTPLSQPDGPPSAELEHWLGRFLAAARPRLGYRWSTFFDGGRHAEHLVVSGLIHGNEVGSLPALVALAEAISAGSVSYGGRITVLLGNPEAARQGVRFLEADLNRVFVDNTLTTHEHERGRTLRPLLDEASLHLDLHQTIEPTHSAFAIFPWSAEGESWVRALDAAPLWVTRAPGQSFSPGTCCADEYVRLAGKPALTIELSQKGFDPGAAARSEAVVSRAMAVLDGIASGGVTLEAAAAAGGRPELLVTAHAERFGDAGRALRPGLLNLQPVAAGTVLSEGGGAAVVAPCDGRLLFPKYPPRGADGRAVAPVPGEIVRVVAPLVGEPAVVFGGAR